MEIKKGFYKHFKGNIYYVIGIATHSESLEKMVIYFHKDKPDEIWVRPLSMWNEIVNGVPRFKYIGDYYTNIENNL